MSRQNLSSQEWLLRHGATKEFWHDLLTGASEGRSKRAREQLGSFILGVLKPKDQSSGVLFKWAVASHHFMILNHPSDLGVPWRSLNLGVSGLGPVGCPWTTHDRPWDRTGL